MLDRAVPFLKWAGGKRQLVPRLLDLAPARIDTYYEPFMGGAALFFALATRGRFARAVLSDTNEELVGCYRAIQEDVDAVIAALRSPKYRNNATHYYRVRDRDVSKMSGPERAARIIFLNRCGYNGLYRVNSKGLFNVPFGRYRNPLICDEERLRAVARALRKTKVKILRADFQEALAKAGPADFVYLDPPYVPVSRTSSFTAYAAGSFGVREQERLAEALRELGRRKVAALLSNSQCAETERLYHGLDSEVVQVRRAINSDARRRGPVGEILVRSFAYPVARPAPVTRFSSDGRATTAA